MPMSLNAKTWIYATALCDIVIWNKKPDDYSDDGLMGLMVDSRVVMAKKELEEMMISSAKSLGPFDDLL